MSDLHLWMLSWLLSFVVVVVVWMFMFLRRILLNISGALLRIAGALEEIAKSSLSVSGRGPEGDE